MPEELAVEEFQKEIDQMNADCVQYNNPENYAKYGKIQRQLLKKEKELKTLKDAATQAVEKAKSEGTLVLLENEPKPLAETEPKKETKTEKPSSFWSIVPKTRLVLTLVFFLLCYIIPIVFAGWIVSDETTLFIHTFVPIDQFKILTSWVFTSVNYGGHVNCFIGFRLAYILCLKFSSALVGTVCETISKAKK